MAGFARRSRANAPFFFLSVAAATDAGKSNSGCPGEIGLHGPVSPISLGPHGIGLGIREGDRWRAKMIGAVAATVLKMKETSYEYYYE